MARVSEGLVFLVCDSNGFGMQGTGMVKGTNKRRVHKGKRERYEAKYVYLVGTVHISQKSARRVMDIIDMVSPDVVCVELDRQRFLALQEMEEGGHFRYSPRAGGLVSLVGLMGWLQWEIGRMFGVVPGIEMLSAIQAAQQTGVSVALIDRPIRISLNRLLKNMSLWERMWLGVNVVAALVFLLLRPVLVRFGAGPGPLFGCGAQVKELEEGTAVSQLMQALKRRFPATYKVLVEERNVHMCSNILSLLKKKSRLVVVVGIGHVAGMANILRAYGVDVRIC